MTLHQFFQTHPKSALAFSGGVDSAYLLWAGLQAEAEVRPYFVKTPFQPQFELEDARQLCRELGVALTVVELDILSAPEVAANPHDRCYHCKRRLFSHLKRYAASEGFHLLLDGTNASDNGGDRPGMRALTELKVRSPLRECGLTKGEIRDLSRQAGLFTWNKPSYACLATRIPTGRAVLRADLENIERGEALLSDLGFRDFRLRLTAEGCKLQVAEDQFSLVFNYKTDVFKILSPLYSEITLDLRPRTSID